MAGPTWNRLPTALPAGGLLPHMSARMRTEMMDALFEGVGGFERARAWIEASDENFGEFFKLWARGQARTNNVEVGASEGIEKLLERLDEAERSNNALEIQGEVVR